MPTLDLDERYFLDSDEHQWMIRDRKNPNEGRSGGITYQPIAFYPTLELALQRYCERYLRRHPGEVREAVRDLADKVEELKAEFEIESLIIK